MSTFSIDTIWYNKLIKLASTQDYEYFVGNDLYRQRQKRDFIEERIRNPRLDYPLIENSQIKKTMSGLEKLKAEITDNEENEFVTRAYTDKIDEKLTELNMVLMAKGMEKAREDEVLQKYSRRFKKLTEKLYGCPGPGMFNFALKIFREKMVKNINHRNFIIGQASEELLKSLPLPEEKYLKKYVFWQNKRHLSRAKKDLMDEIQMLFTTGEENKLHKPDEIRDFFTGKINQLGLTDWLVEINGNYQSISVDQNKKIIFVPKTRSMDSFNLEKLMLHEIGVHVIRRENGDRSKLKLLGLGLANYELGEEGLASIVEGLFHDQTSFNFSHLLSYVAIGLVYGEDGTKRDFRDIFIILLKLYLYIGLVNFPDKDIEGLKNKAINNAFNRCVRIFRGTSCQIPGVCFTRDLIYLKGKICLWDVINHNPKELKRIYCGKYNPADERHIKLLDNLGIR